MADSTLDSELFVLEDHWPGVGRQTTFGQIPKGGFTGNTHHNVATPAYPVGEKLCVENMNQTGTVVGKAGFSTFIYLQVGTQDATTIIAKHICVLDSATLWYQLTNDPDSCIAVSSSLMAIAISPITNAFWGWFWCGGVCPESHVAGLGGNYITNDLVAAGLISTGASAATVLAFLPYATTLGQCGFALADDAA